MSVTQWRVLKNLINFRCNDEGGRLDELGAEAMANIENSPGENTDVIGGYGNLFKKIADDDGVTDVV
jgi:hypothetical protein